MLAFCIQGGTRILSVRLNESSHGENIHVTTTRIKTQRHRLQQHPSRLLPGSPQLPAPPRSPPILALRAVGEHRARSRPRGLCRSALSVGFAQAGGRGSLALHCRAAFSARTSKGRWTATSVLAPSSGQSVASAAAIQTLTRQGAAGAAAACGFSFNRRSASSRSASPTRLPPEGTGSPSCPPPNTEALGFSVLAILVGVQ